jgi:hypothetical protein
MERATRRGRGAVTLLVAAALLGACEPAAEGPDPAREDPAAPEDEQPGY